MTDLIGQWSPRGVKQFRMLIGWKIPEVLAIIGLSRSLIGASGRKSLCRNGTA